MYTNYNTNNTISGTYHDIKNLPDTRCPSDTYETSRSSDGRAASGNMARWGDSLRHGGSCTCHNHSL